MDVLMGARLSDQDKTYIIGELVGDILSFGADNFR